MKINVKKVKVSTITQEVSETFKSGDVVIFLGRAIITEARFKDNFDSTHNATYIAKPEIVDLRRSEDQTSIVDEVKIKQKSRSQALRQKAWAIAQEIGESEEALYNSAIDEAEQWLDNKRDEEVGL